jgi:hypothetical protein
MASRDKPKFLIVHRQTAGALYYDWVSNSPVIYAHQEAELQKAILEGSYEYVFFPYNQDPFWHSGRSFARNVVRYLKTKLRHSENLVQFKLLRWLKESNTKLVVFNTHDSPMIPRRDEVLLESCECYFLRELP